MEKITTHWRYWNLTNYSKKRNRNFADDPIITSIKEHEQKLCFAIWTQMEFLSEKIGIDDPAVVIRELEDSISYSCLAHDLEYEDIDNDPKDEDPLVTSIKEHEQKLKFAIWTQMEFLSEKIGMDYPEQVIDTVEESIEKYISEYSPVDESFEEFED